MADNLLYFPYINLPDNFWTFRALMYYNTVSTIAPGYYIEDKNKFEPLMQTLVRRNLVIPLNPMDVLSRPWELDDPFMDFVQSPAYKLSIRRTAFRRTFVDPNGRLCRNPSMISREKFNGDLLPKLESIGLASRSYDDFYNVEKKTANYLINYLSNIIAQKRNLLPATDSINNLKARVLYRGKMLDNTIDNRRSKVLEGVLPMPRELNLDKLMDFKFNYSMELSLFRNVVEQIAFDPKYNDEDLLSEKIAELNYHKMELVERMLKGRKNDLIFGTVFGLTSAVVTIATAPSLGVAALGLPAFINAIYTALKIDNPQKIHDTTGMKYLALASRKLK